MARILEAVGSSSVKVFYDTANMEKRGYDIYAEIRRLGKDRICEIHCKENGFLLGKGPVDFRKVKDIPLEIGWQGGWSLRVPFRKTRTSSKPTRKTRNICAAFFEIDLL